MERPQPDKLEALKHLFHLRAGESTEHTETGEQLNLESERFEEVEGSDVLGVYEHYKSTPTEPKHYYVGAVKYDTEKGEYLVAYTPLYGIDESKRYARPLDMFLGIVEQDGELTARFRRLET